MGSSEKLARLKQLRTTEPAFSNIVNRLLTGSY